MKKQLFLHLLPSTLHPSFQDFQFLRCFLWHLFTIIFLSKMLLSNIWIYRFSWLSVDFWKYTSAIWRVSIFFEHSSILVISWFPKIEVIQFAFSAFLTAVVQECNLEFLNQMLLLKFWFWIEHVAKGTCKGRHLLTPMWCRFWLLWGWRRRGLDAWFSCHWCDVLAAVWARGPGDSGASSSAAGSVLGTVPGDSRGLPDLTASFPTLTSQSGVCHLQRGTLTYTPGGRSCGSLTLLPVSHDGPVTIFG